MLHENLALLDQVLVLNASAGVGVVQQILLQIVEVLRIPLRVDFFLLLKLMQGNNAEPRYRTNTTSCRHYTGSARWPAVSK